MILEMDDSFKDALIDALTSALESAYEAVNGCAKAPGNIDTKALFSQIELWEFCRDTLTGEGAA